MPFHIILENVAGKLDEQNDDPELAEAVIDFIQRVGSLRDGDIIRIVEQSVEELEGRPENDNQ